jgi:hypothetical protein
LDAAFDFRCRSGSPDFFEIEKILQIQPELSVGLEVPGQAQGGVRRDAAPLMHDLPNTGGGDMQLKREFIDRQSMRLHEIFPKNLARMHGRLQLFGLLHGRLLVVIIHDFHVKSIATAPDKTDTPLIVDANRILAGSTASLCFQPVAGRRSENKQFGGGVKLQELS